MIPAKPKRENYEFSRVNSKTAKKTPKTEFGAKNADGKKFRFSRLNPNFKT